MLAALLIAFAIAPAPVWQEPVGSISGRVVSEGAGTPLRFAMVEAVVPGRSPLTAVTDSLGRYTLRSVPAGRRILRVTHYDHAPHETELAVLPGSNQVLDLFLELRPVQLEAVTARTVRAPGVSRDTARAVGGQADLGTAGLHVIEATPGVAELGLAEAAREVPGQEPPDPTDVLFVRGGAADLKLVLLDGAPVYAPFHLGGLIDALDVSLLRSARLYLGGAPARYDGGLSYVMDLETRPGRRDDSHAVAGLDLLSARAVIEGPLGRRIGYMVGGRALHGLGGEPFVGDPFPYTYGDALARLDADFGRIGRVAATGFWNRESVRLDTLRSQEAAAWGNSAGSIRYYTRVAGATMVLTTAFGSFNTQLPLGGSRPLVTEGTSERFRVALDGAAATGGVRFQFGGAYDQSRFAYRAWGVGASPDSTLLRSVAEGDVLGGYVEATIPAARRLLLRAGLRGDVFSIAPSLRLAPRLSATLMVGERSSLTVSGGRYRQYVRAPAQSLVFLGTAIPDTVSTPPLALARANHFIVAVDHDMGDGLVLGVEGFYKAYDGVPGAGGSTAEASGVDLWVRRSAGRVDGWLGYSLAWIWSLDEDRIRPTHNFAGRHLMSGGVVGPMPGGGIFDVRLGYGAGLPYTAIPEPEAGTPVFSMMPSSGGVMSAAVSAMEVPGPPAGPDQPYVRLDAQVARTFRSDWRGHDFQVTPYVKVLNALNRRDALFYHYDRAHEGAEPRAIAAIPVLPIVGVEWRF